MSDQSLTVLSSAQKIEAIQKILFPDKPKEWDSLWGPRSQGALDEIVGRRIEYASKGSWYSQYEGRYSWVDKGDRPGSNALGVPDDQQGIALPARVTLGKWFLVTAPNGVTLRLQQTDLGPAEWTGRKIDIAAVAAERFGYTPKNFPTDEVFKWTPA